MDGFEKCGYGRDRFWMSLEADELRVVTVALGFSSKDFLRQQRFAPECDEAFGIEVFGVDGPESHRHRQTNCKEPKEHKEFELGTARPEELGR